MTGIDIQPMVRHPDWLVPIALSRAFSLSHIGPFTTFQPPVHEYGYTGGAKSDIGHWLKMAITTILALKPLANQS
jgi:hypothetical protein